MDLQKKIENAIPHDKLLHFTIGLLLALPAFICCWLVLLPMIFGIIKEVYDKYVRKTGFDWADIAATGAGIVPVGIVFLFLYITT